MTVCEKCGVLFTASAPPAWAHWPPEDARLIFCPPCLAGWRAHRDQRYADAKAANETECAQDGHHFLPDWMLFHPMFGACVRCQEPRQAVS